MNMDSVFLSARFRNNAVAQKCNIMTIYDVEDEANDDNYLTHIMLLISRENVIIICLVELWEPRTVFKLYSD